LASTPAAIMQAAWVCRHSCRLEFAKAQAGVDGGRPDGSVAERTASMSAAASSGRATRFALSAHGWDGEFPGWLESDIAARDRR
jgi:hypothetical protein